MTQHDEAINFAMDSDLAFGIFLALLLAHVVGDFVIQTDRDVSRKRELHLPAFARHAAIHGLLAYIAVGIAGFLVLPLIVLAVHGVIDIVKESIVRRCRPAADPAAASRRKLAVLTIDQAVHVASLAALAAWLLPEIVQLGSAWWAGSWWVTLFGTTALDAAVMLIGLITAVWVGAVVITLLIRPYLAELQDTAGGDGPDGDGSDSDGSEEVAETRAGDDRGFVKGGRMIGLLERALVFGFVLSGHLTAVGFLVAAKSVFRFGEIRDPGQRREAEYILIGTLMSFTWALAVAWLTHALL